MDSLSEGREAMKSVTSWIVIGAEDLSLGRNDAACGERWIS